VTQQVLPTFAIVLAMGALPAMGDVELSQILHAEQSVTLHADIATDGRARSITEITGIHDKGKGALVTARTNVRDAASDELLAILEMGIFVRGAGGFGGDRGPSADWAAPDREPDATVGYDTAVNQALVYRLSGDRNPLHSDPGVATAVGFPRPILHGLCTFGFTGRALLAAVCDGDPSRFGAMRARFSAPVLPGQRLEVSIWKDDDGGALYRTATEAGVVLDHGRFTPRG
jgi:acyl dehydratase